MRFAAISTGGSVVLKIVFLAVFIVAANFAAREIVEVLDFTLRPSNEDLVHRLLMALAVAYTTLLAIPFVPGVEIGFALIAVIGKPIVPLLYACTLFGLTVSFAVGRLLSLQTIARLFDALHLERASGLLARIAPMKADERLAFLAESAPSRLVPALLRHRYVALALLLNLPGNFLIGGGGGIALVAGLSGLYTVPGFLLTLALAVAPLPLLVLVFGTGVVLG